MLIGPFLPDSPWSLLGPILPAAPAGSPPVPPPPPAPPGAKPLIAYDPNIDPRLRRFTQVLTDIANSLIRQDELIKTGPSTWTLGGAGGGPTGTFTDSF